MSSAMFERRSVPVQPFIVHRSDTVQWKSVYDVRNDTSNLDRQFFCGVGLRGAASGAPERPRRNAEPPPHQGPWAKLSRSQLMPNGASIWRGPPSAKPRAALPGIFRSRLTARRWPIRTIVALLVSRGRHQDDSVRTAWRRCKPVYLRGFSAEELNH